MSARVATVIGLVVFLVLSGTGISFAYWSTTASVSGTVAVADPATTNCSSIVKLTNGGFESPDLGTTPWVALPPGAAPAGVPGWLVQNDTTIEIWKSQLGSTPPEGAQIAELNGTGFSTLYQDVATTPGQTLRWSLAHRGREGTDSMRVSINAAGAGLVQQDQWSTTQTAFVRHEGVYVVPAGQTTTRISLIPVATANNNVSIGNLIDDVTFGTGPCLQSSTAITNVTRGGTNFYSGDVVEYVTTIVNNGGNHALGSTFSAVVPTGLTYQAGSLLITGAARTDATGDDQADYVSGTRTIAARIGAGATSAAGGTVAPANTVTVRFRATIPAAAVGTTVTYTPSLAYTDPLAPTWPITTAATPASITPAANGADIAVTVLSSPNLAPSASRTWTFRVTNNGPDAGSNVRVAVTIPAGLTVASGGVTATTATCDATGTTRNCIFTGSIAVGATRDITVTGTLPATLTGTYGVVAATNPQTTPATTTDPVAGNNSVTNNGILDTTAPTAPTGLTVGTTTATTVPLSWTASTDAVGVTGYRVYRNGTLVTTTTGTGTTYTDTGRTAGQPYWYWVQAVDAAGNVSTASNGVGAITAFGTGNWHIRNTPYSNRCLATSSDFNNALLRSSTCTTTGNDDWEWAFVADAGGRYRLEPEDGNTRRWDLTTGTAAAGELLRVSSDNTAATRTLWTPTVVWDSSLNASYIAFRHNTSSLCLNVGSTANDTQVTLQACSDTLTNQRFLLSVP